MPQLHIALQDGFNGQNVAIEVDGVAVYRRDGVRTDLRISRAEAVEVATSAAHVLVSVSIEPGHLHGTYQIDVLATPYLQVSIQPSGTLQFTPSAQMPLYM